MPERDAFSEVTSFEMPAPTAVGAGADGIVAATGDRLTYVRGADRRALGAVDDPIDVTVAEFVYVLTGEGIEVLADDGTRGHEPIEGDPEAIAALPGEDVVCVLTADRLLAYDGEIEQRLWAVDRPYADVVAETTFVGAHGRFLLGRWSFVVGFDAGGNRILEYDLDSTITGLGATDETAVVGLQNGTLVGLDLASGEETWRSDVEAREITQAGEQHVVVRTGDGLLAVAADGSYEPVDEVPDGRVYAPRSDERLFVHREGTLAAYRRGPGDRLAVAVESGEVTAGGSVSLRIENEGDAPASRTIALDAPGVEFVGRRRTVEIAAGEAATVSFEVAGVPTADERVTVEATVDGRAVATDELAVTNDTGVTAELEPVAVRNGVLEARLSASNGRDTAVVLSVPAADADLGTVPPGERAATTVTAPFDPDASHEVAVVDGQGDRVATASLELAAGPVALDATTGTEDGYPIVEVSVENPTGATVVDELVVGSDAADAPTVERTVECDPGSTWTLVVLAAGPAGAALDGTNVVARLSALDATATVSPDMTATGEAPEAAEAGAETAVELDRSLSPDDPRRGGLFFEYVRATVDGQADVLAVSAGDQSHEVEQLGGEVRLRRGHAAFADASLAPVTAAIDGEQVETLPERPLPVEPADVVLRVAIEGDGSSASLTAAVENASDEPFLLDRLAVVGFGDVTFEDVRIRPDDSRVVNRRLDRERSIPNTSALPVAIEGTLGGASREVRTLGAYRPDAAPTASGTGSGTEALSDVLAVDVDERTKVTEEVSEGVWITLRNASDRPVDDLGLQANSEHINERVHQDRTIEELAPGEEEPYYVDVKPEGIDAIAVRVDCDATEYEPAELYLSGPVARTESAWSDADREEWTVEWAGEADATGPDLPDLLSTPFELKNKPSD